MERNLLEVGGRLPFRWLLNCMACNSGTATQVSATLEHRKFDYRFARP
jgi:hypothetical protein